MVFQVQTSIRKQTIKEKHLPLSRHQRGKSLVGILIYLGRAQVFFGIGKKKTIPALLLNCKKMVNGSNTTVYQVNMKPLVIRMILQFSMISSSFNRIVTQLITTTNITSFALGEPGKTTISDIQFYKNTMRHSSVKKLKYTS